MSPTAVSTEMTPPGLLTDILFSQLRLAGGSTRYIASFVIALASNDQDIIQCNPELSALISKTLKVDKAVWLKDLTKLEGLLPFTEDAAFRKEWAAIKFRNKERLARYVHSTLGLKINTHAMFDVQIKVRISIFGESSNQ